MTSAASRIEALMKIHPKGYDLSLDRIEKLLEKLGSPQNKLPPIIHVAGTNGKGSTIAFTRSILEAAGLSVHVHTSPHLVNWNERYRLGQKGGAGQLTPDGVLSDAIRRVAEANDGQPITVFEVLTAVSFVLFSEHSADVCLIEVGLGGRLDCTNVMKETALTIITPVSIDHEAFLGDTLGKIAFEKAGIIKRKTPLVVGAQEPEALAVIEQQASRNLAPAFVSGEHYSGGRENGRMIFENEDRLLDLSLPRLPGDHQVSNAATAIQACLKFCLAQGFELNETAIEHGLRTVDWPGRMQKLPAGKLTVAIDDNVEIWLDGGHNPGAAAMVAKHMADLEERDPRPLVMICGMLDTKDPAGYFNEFSSLAERVFTVPIQSSDAGVPADRLAQLAAESGLSSQTTTSLQEAITLAAQNAPVRILICGSLYLVGDALAQNETPTT